MTVSNDHLSTSSPSAIVAWNGSAESRSALLWALERASPDSGSLTLLTVINEAFRSCGTDAMDELAVIARRALRAEVGWLRSVEGYTSRAVQMFRPIRECEKAENVVAALNADAAHNVYLCIGRTLVLANSKGTAMSTLSLLRPLTLGAAAAVAAVTVIGLAAPASAETAVPEPSSFTSAFTVMATPDQVLNTDGVATPGEAGATGQFNFRVNSDLDVICYDITLTGVTGDYVSPAKTATHIHEAALGQAGPPRIAFPNPAPVGDGPRTSSGCLQGPFTTGIVANGVDTGTGFTLKALEANANAYASDAHTVNFPAGVVRGQLSQMPVGGLQTGGGATAAATDGSDASAVLSIGAGAAAVLGLAGFVLYRRRSIRA